MTGGAVSKGAATWRQSVWEVEMSQAANLQLNHDL